MPASAAEPYDSNELQLIADGRRLSLANYQQYQAFENDKRRALTTLEASLADVPAVCDSLLSSSDLEETVEQKLAAERAILVAAGTQLLTERADLNHYRLVNGINDKAVYPAYPAAPYLYLLPALLLETLWGAYFYENVNGLLGGAVVALSLSLINLAVAFGGGAMFRYKNLASPRHRVFGWGLGGLSIIICIYLNTLYAKYRSTYALVADPTEAAQLTAAFKQAMVEARGIFLFEAPADDVTSFGLFAVGLILCAWAFWKGMHVDDQRPGYGPRARRYDAAQAAYDHECARIKGLVQAEIAKQQEEIARAKMSLIKASPSLAQIKAALESEYGSMHAHQKQLQENFALVLLTYRKANIAVRQSQPPKYFADMPEVAADALADGGDALHPLLDRVTAQIELLRENYLQRLTDTLQGMANTTKVMLGKRYADYVDDLLAESKSNLSKKAPVGPLATLTGGLA